MSTPKSGIPRFSLSDSTDSEEFHRSYCIHLKTKMGIAESGKFEFRNSGVRWSVVVERETPLVKKRNSGIQEFKSSVILECRSSSGTHLQVTETQTSGQPPGHPPSRVPASSFIVLSSHRRTRGGVLAVPRLGVGRASVRPAPPL